MKAEIKIRKARLEDYDSIWTIIEEVIQKGDTYVFETDSSKEEMLSYWCGREKHTYVAVFNNEVIGTFIIKDNFPGLGAHIANASYMVPENASGKGVGSAMGKYSLEEAKRLGYKAMQFNIVVKSNVRAIRLWKKLGFEVIGEIPEAFNHKTKGFTNALIMWRKL